MKVILDHIVSLTAAWYTRDLDSKMKQKSIGPNQHAQGILLTISRTCDVFQSLRYSKYQTENKVSVNKNKAKQAKVYNPPLKKT